MRILCKLGELQVAALVDTGSDYDALDAELSKLQEARGNTAFVDRNHKPPVEVKGFQENMSCTLAGESRWFVSLEGSKVLHGKRQMQVEEWTFAEFQGLGLSLIHI